MGRNAHKKFYSKTYDHSYELVVKKSQKKIKIYIMHYIGVFGVKPWNSPKKIKVSIDGSPTKSQKTMGTLIFLVNYTKNTYLCIFFTWLWIQNEGKSISYQFCPNGFSKTLTALVCMSKKACHFLKVPKTPRLAGPQAASLGSTFWWLWLCISLQ